MLNSSGTNTSECVPESDGVVVASRSKDDRHYLGLFLGFGCFVVGQPVLGVVTLDNGVHTSDGTAGLTTDNPLR